MSKRQNYHILLKEADRDNNSTETKRLIKSLLKSGKLTPKEIVSITDVYYKQGKIFEIFKLLGNEEPLYRMKVLGQGALLLQLELAMTLATQGALYVARRIIDNLRVTIEERGFIYKRDFYKFHYYYAYVQSRSGFHEKVFELADQALDFYKDNQFQKLALLRILIITKISQSKFSQVKKMIKEMRSLTESPVYGFLRNSFALEILLFLKKQDYTNAKKLLDVYKTRFKENQQFDRYHHLMQGLYFQGVGQKKRAINAYLMGIKNGQTFMRHFETYRIYRLLFELDGESMNPRDVISLFCFPGYVEDYELLKNTKDYNCIVYENEKIQFKNYKYLQHKSEKRIIDLVAGTVLNNAYEIQSLGELKALFLQAVIGAGEMGMSIIALADRVYRSDFFDPTSALERIRKLKSELEKIGFKIKKVGKRYHYVHNNDDILYIPFKEIHPDPIHYTALNFNKFNKRNIQNLFNISPSSAKRWITQWEQLNYIKKSGANRATQYEILEEVKI